MNFTLIEAAAGDCTAKEALAARLHPRLARMAHYYGRRCGEDPDDLLQEAWLGVLEALPRVDVTIGCPEQHLLRRAKWRLLDAIKRARVRRCLPLEEAALDAEPEFDSAPESACVEQFLAGLSVPHRKLVECLLEGMTWREAGAELGCTSANVAYHMRKIRSQFDAWHTEEVRR